jgi:hypothetical protein
VAARLARQLIGREGHADRRFAPINNNGWLISEAGAQYKPSFDLNKAIALKTGEHGLDFLLTMIKLRGFDGKADFCQYGLEGFTLMSGRAAEPHIKIYATCPPFGGADAGRDGGGAEYRRRTADVRRLLQGGEDFGTRIQPLMTSRRGWCRSRRGLPRVFSSMFTERPELAIFCFRASQTWQEAVLQGCCAFDPAVIASVAKQPRAG